MGGLESLERLRGEIRDDLERTGGSSTSVRSERVLSALGEIERELTERCVLLPVGADGVVWTYVDEWFVDKHGDKYQLECMKIERDGEWLLRSPLGWHLASNCRHVKPCTIKEVLVEYRNKCEQLVSALECGAIDAEEYRQRLVGIDEKYAAELQMRGDDE